MNFRFLSILLMTILLLGCDAGGNVKSGGTGTDGGSTAGQADDSGSTPDGANSDGQADAGADSTADGSSGGNGTDTSPTDGSSTGSSTSDGNADGSDGAGDGSDDAGEPPPVDPLTLGRFELRLDATYYELLEENENGITVPIHLSRLERHVRPVQITVQSVEAQGPAFSAELEQATLQGAEIYTSWRAELGVAAAPILASEQTFTVTANDGVDEFVIPFTLAMRPIAVPDVYLLIGQSNMEGNSEFGSRDSSVGGLDAVEPRIRQLNVRQNNRELFDTDERFTDENFNVMDPRYVVAEDPLHEPRFVSQSGKGGTFIGLGLSFAKAALPHTSQEIILVPAAWSGRGFCANDDAPLSWMAEESDESALGGTLLVDRALTRLNMALRDTGGVFRGILWHQGEADSNSEVCSIRYEGNLIKLSERIRTDAQIDPRGESARGPNASVPFIVGTMSRGNDDRGSFSNFNSTKQRVDDAHRNVPNLIPFADVSLADDLVPEAYPCGQVSCVHFGAAAYRELGIRYFDALQRVQAAVARQ